ncbi:MAG TPA: hypothetical protein VF027_05070 [Sphingomicrobium sp.]
MRKLFLTGVFAAIVSVPAISVAAPDGKNRKVTVANMSNHVLRELYASPVTAKTWEEDMLGQRTLASGKTISANIDNGTNECYYDLKGVMDNGRTVEERNVNVCAASKWVIGETSDSVQ